jgi:hypothetical protein
MKNTKERIDLFQLRLRLMEQSNKAHQRLIDRESELIALKQKQIDKILSEVAGSLAERD